MEAVGDSQIRSDVALLYRRAGFGASPEVLDAATAAGYDATLERLLSPPRSDPGLGGVSEPSLELPNPGQLAGAAQRKATLATLRLEEPGLAAWWLTRMVLADNPFPEKLTLFWHGHFATAISKVQLPALMYRQNQLFRTLGAGTFDTLTMAAAQDPAMLIWLDAGSDQKADPNENFARELMELFTLGIGNYTEEDVRQGARAFTGWRLDPIDWEYAFDPLDHDDGVKTFLGHTGNLTGEDVIDIVTHDPVGHRWVAASVWSHFAYPVSPNDPIVTDLVGAYGDGLDLSALYRAVFTHPAFLSDATRNGLVKQPIEYVVGAVRALAPGLVSDPSSGLGAKTLYDLLRLLGQTPFDPPNVGGWPQNQFWLTTASSLERLKFAARLVVASDLSDLIAQSPADRPAYLAHLLGVDGWGPSSAAALDASADIPEMAAALALVSPEYVSN